MALTGKVLNLQSIQGSITPKRIIQGSLQRRATIRGNVVRPTILTGDVEVYSGSYVVTPKVDSQMLNTANKFLQNNVDIHGIPYYEVSNTSGGSTVYIGTEVLYG